MGAVGAAGCVWWLSSLDNFTPKERVMAILAYGGLSAAWTLESGLPEGGPRRALQIAEMAVALA